MRTRSPIAGNGVGQEDQCGVGYSCQHRADGEQLAGIHYVRQVGGGYGEGPQHKTQLNRNGQPGDVGPGIPAFSLQRRGDSIGAEPNSQAKHRGCDHEGQGSPPTGVFLEFS